MTRREALKQGMSGGTAAPRRDALRAALSKAQPRGPGGRSELPGNPRPMPFPRVGSQRPQQNMGLNAPVKLGAQLRGRVQSGAIDQAQGQRTARQRQLLQKAFGPDWRTKVYGQGGAKGVTGSFAPGQIRAKRSAALERARRKY